MDADKITPPIVGHDLLKSRTLYVSDLDGTLLDSTSKVSPASVRLLNEAISAGAMFTVATARTPATAITLLHDVEMKIPGAVMTGAALFDFSTHVFSRLQYLPEGVTGQLLPMYRKNGVSTFIYTFNGIRLEVYHTGELNQYEKLFVSERSHTPVKHFSVPPSGDSVLPGTLDNTLLLYSVQPWARAKALYDEIVSHGIAVTPLCYHDTYGDDWGQIEMFGPATSKAAAIESVASDTGAGRIVAFGDNVNDMPVLRLADTAVAVGNAVDEVKRLADEIIATNNEDAVAHFILNHFKC